MISSLMPMAESALWRAPLTDAPLANFPQALSGIFTPGVLARIDDPAQKDPILFTNAAAITNAWRLRSYQETMLEGLREDIRSGTSPLLALSSPMQTGKSLMTGPIIRMLKQELGNIRVFVLTGSRVITRQIEEDLLQGFPPEEVGRFDALVKEPRSVTIASILSLARNVDQFPTEQKTVLILDEAYATQSPSVRKILRHFGLAEKATEGNRKRIIPLSGNGLVIGFSGTGAGLDGYKISGRLSLLEAMEAGWVRHMRGERLSVRIESQRMLAAGGERVIWWTATPENAEFLARVFEEKIRPRARKSLIFVPTIRHGRLLKKALGKMYGRGFARFIHSDLNPDLVSSQLQAWRDRGGALISVRMLSRGFRATGADAVFHTYQTSSLELFGQRTGRAWGVVEGVDLPDLYVLEATWSAGGEFANLPRLAGLVDYPKDVFETRTLKEASPAIQKKTEQRKRRSEAIRKGKVSPLFARVPMSHEWGRFFSEILEKTGGSSALAKMTGLKLETIAAFELGVIPTRLAQVESLKVFWDGLDPLHELWWVRLWKTAVEEIRAGYEDVDDETKQKLSEWYDSILHWFSSSASNHLDELNEYLEGYLDRLFSKGMQKETWRAVFIRKVRGTKLASNLSEEELTRIFQETLGTFLPTLSDKYRDIFRRAVLEDPPTPQSVLAKEYNDVTSKTINALIRKIADRLYQVVRGRLLKGLAETMSEEDKITTHPIFWIPVDEMAFPEYICRSLRLIGIKYLGELVKMEESELQQGMRIGLKTFREIKAVLIDLGLDLGMTITWPKP